MGEATREACWEQAQSLREILADVWEAVDSGTEYEDTDPLEYLDEMPLEIVWEMGEPFAVVFGTGGPHTEIVGGGRQGGFQLWCYWAGERACATGAAVTRTGEYFRERVEDMS